MKQILALFILMLTLTGNCRSESTINKQNNMITSMGKSYSNDLTSNQGEEIFLLQVRAEGVYFELMINDVLVLEEQVNGYYNFSNGIDHHLVPGENKIELAIYDYNRENAFVEAKISHGDVEKEERFWKNYSDIRLEPFNREFADGKVVLADQFIVDVPIKETPKVTGLYLNLSNCRVAVYLNGIEMANDDSDEDKTVSISIPIIDELIDGENVLIIKVSSLNENGSSFLGKLATHGTDSNSFFDDSSWVYHALVEADDMLKEEVYEVKFNYEKK